MSTDVYSFEVSSFALGINRWILLPGNSVFQLVSLNGAFEVVFDKSLNGRSKKKTRVDELRHDLIEMLFNPLSDDKILNRSKIETNCRLHFKVHSK